MIVLAVDSSSKVATVALMKDDKLLGEITLNDKKEHSVILMTIIEDLLKFNNLTIDDIDGYVVSKGPGSFTGLRIGMATVKGLSFGSGKPYVSLSSLDALAFSVANFDGLICPIMDALRNSVYTSLYKSCNGSLEKLMDYSALDMDELVEIIKSKGEKVIFIGDGLDKYKDYLIENCPNCYFPPNHLNLVRASSLGEIGSKLLRDGQFDDPNSTPFYLKKPQAEREYEQRMQLRNECNC
ncbi:tRNA (adenosine(37)-N6)-threonylcarbamoyltransferase complex dimerization subunit type 1 TsaB [Clostridium saccharobutylicum]|uniref:tRNA threonylcarbamoyl adenosine modification protein YeaZ n=1 Tax=Clostridium saccharobutylicum DSM 13864 TaxID=1345695 RepID=U5MM40_CLOSA|nr:tRNA (adenosine(37)-N6)-threonylcarbamoyltransferase complex dimerization subunit type 1 TsaB [Clostridium saccharobutylicum]AGX41588.1 tRNA threonylcarbamoyl adenosine modification protein YeaZ [Clostridium saccharobutylicum DSM 13864]AQR88868.1 tRNA threonylcarbamoyladenosine biosynthesis protein TsaB [Clostridium saccharobutylicum]AQR98767.1 tRNA threonylcarbamoyladenosine biosynthesis protein TsaB [Clostridium saccharobutylicum]AQS08492.1 tRNA threonylcarbamoyladenosine biosynthesis prot